MKTMFTLSCKNWADLESPLTYVFSYESRSGRTTLFYRTIGSGSHVSVTEWLPVGDKENGYNLTIIINIKDSLGGETERVRIVKVHI